MKPGYDKDGLPVPGDEQEHHFYARANSNPAVIKKFPVPKDRSNFVIRRWRSRRVGLPVVEKITRDAFLFLEAPTNINGEDHAQCVSCRMFVPQKALAGFRNYDLCIGHGSNVEVGPRYSCGFYSPWPKGPPNPEVVADHAAELKKNIPASFTPEESGLVEREVRCENCAHEREHATRCNVFYTLNKMQPTMFDMNDKVSPHDCCNAQTEKPVAE